MLNPLKGSAAQRSRQKVMELSMKKALTLVLAAGSVAAVAAPALAQDNSAFTGPRVEALLGYDITRPGSTVDIDNADDIDQSIEDITYGVGIGYDFAVGGVVLGVEGEWMNSDANSKYNTSGFENYGIAAIDSGRDLYAGVRAGVLVTPSTLLYAKGGYTNARYNVTASDGVVNLSTNANLDGWRAGAGVEHAFNDNVYLKGEYRYSNYGKGQFRSPEGAATDRFDVDVDRHQFVVGVGYRF